MQFSNPGGSTLEPTPFPPKRLFFMHVSSWFSLRSSFYDMSSELGFFLGWLTHNLGLVSPHCEQGLWPRTRAAWITGEKMLPCQAIPTVAFMLHIQQRAGPSSQLLPAQKVPSDSDPNNWGHVLLCKQYWWEMADSSSLWSLGNEKEEEGEGRRPNVFIFLC